MRKKAERMLWIVAVVLTVFIGKGIEAKAYEVVGGVAYMTEDEYNAAERRGNAPEKWMIGEIFREGSGAINVMRWMDEYVPRAYFDYDWYLQKHPELADICGTDKDAIYDYYANIGQANGWQGRVARDKLIDASNFDYMRYAAENPDVTAVLGQDAAVLYAHYVNNGIQEGRKGYSTDDLINVYLKVYDVSSQIMNDTMGDEEKIKAVHDWMCLNIAYDYDNYEKDTVPGDSYSIRGAIGKGVAVCEGYQGTFKTFMDIQGIECEEVDGMVDAGFHGWNRVKLGGEYYYIDVTWDDPAPDEPGRVQYDYYLTKDSTMGGTHLSNEDQVALWFEE